MIKQSVQVDPLEDVSGTCKRARPRMRFLKANGTRLLAGEGGTLRLIYQHASTPARYPGWLWSENISAPSEWLPEKNKFRVFSGRRLFGRFHNINSGDVGSRRSNADRGVGAAKLFLIFVLSHHVRSVEQLPSVPPSRSARSSGQPGNPDGRGFTAPNNSRSFNNTHGDWLEQMRATRNSFGSFLLPKIVEHIPIDRNRKLLFAGIPGTAEREYP
ncbi:hypothetical protein V8F06_010487 [Rhypophila decipiens]